MTGHRFTESDVEQAALDWLSELACGYKFGLDIAPEMPDAERQSVGETGDYDRLAANPSTSTENKTGGQPTELNQS